MQPVADQMAVEGKAEGAGAGTHPFEMPVEPDDTIARVEAHRLYQIKITARHADIFPLGQTFLPFRPSEAVCDNARTEADGGASIAIAQRQCADRDVEGRFTARRDKAD